MQAIQTKYIPATNTRGSRIKATCERGSVTIPYPDELSGHACHIAAADALVAKFAKEDAARYGTDPNPWLKPRVCGGLPDGTCAHIFAGMENHMILKFANAEDFENAKRYLARARANLAKDPGTPLSGLYASILLCALGRSA